VVRQGIAHCFVKENRVVEEWIVRDELALIRQLGFDEIALAKRMVAREAASGIKAPYLLGYGEVDRVAGQTTPEPVPPPSGTFNIEEFARRAMHEIWNWRLLNKLPQYYVPAYLCRTSTNRQLYGLGDYKAYILGMLAAFPDARLSVDHVCALGNDQAGYRVAIRWTLQGTHSGPGVYGEPTGKRILLLGITHAIVQNGKFVKEWTAFDEFALLKQLYAPEARLINQPAPSAAIEVDLPS
jgi:predicted ester cyclase